MSLNLDDLYPLRLYLFYTIIGSKKLSKNFLSHKLFNSGIRDHLIK